MSEALFWLALAPILYHHAVYPFVLRRLADRVRRRPFATPNVRGGGDHQSITMVIPAHNEAKVIGAKLENCARLDAPGRFKVLLVLDGCTDDSGKAAAVALARHPDLACEIVEMTTNVGKVQVLNHAIARCDSEIVAVSDASSALEADALRRLAAYFQDPEVGVVCPTYQVPEDTLSAERTYWAHQRRVKADEAALGAPMGAHGACYLIRRSLWRPLKSNTINDDFIIPMAIVARGSRAVYDLDVASAELEPTTVPQNFWRRVRIGAGNLQQVFAAVGLSHPRRPGLAFVFLSGKVLRAFMPFLLAVLFVSSFALAMEGRWAFQLLSSAMTVLLLAAGALLAKPCRLPAKFDLAAYMVQSYVAAGLGCLLLMSGRADRAWRVSRWRFGSKLRPQDRQTGVGG